MHKRSFLLSLALAPYILQAQDISPDSPSKTLHHQKPQETTHREKKQTIKKLLKTENAELQEQYARIQKETVSTREEIKAVHESVIACQSNILAQLKSIFNKDAQNHQQLVELEKQINLLSQNIEKNEQEYLQKIAHISQQLRRTKGWYALGGSVGTLVILSSLFYFTPTPPQNATSVTIP